MVWFQCEDCGEELKKPKLPNHFRICSAYKLSCIDCGETFDRQRVQTHTQCITEAEKYGPKGQGKAATGTPAKPNKDKPKPDVDINVGLSERPPWFCSLCNTQATSKQALLLHADGKKHRAKARAYAAKQQPNPPEEGAVTNKDSTEITPKNDDPEDKSGQDDKSDGFSDGASEHANSSAENGNVSMKKRKIDMSNSVESKEAGLDLEVKLTKIKRAKFEEENGKRDKTGTRKEGFEQKIKWKKLITSVLKSTSDGAFKMKKLRKLVLKSLQDSDIAMDDSEFKTTLEHKVNSSSKFVVDGKYVRLSVKKLKA